MIDFASFSDRNALSSLWQSVFLEDEEVTEYFFDNIFGDIVTPVIRIDGEIVSSLFLLDCKIGEHKGKCVYCAMTKYAHRGKGYMETLLDYSYKICIENGFEFLVLVPAEKSLFEYYKKCGFEKFGIRRSHTFDGTTPENKGKLNFQCKLTFSDDILKYWENTCIHYGGEALKSGLAFDEENIIIRNGFGDFEDFPEKYRTSGNIVQGNITFGENEIPAMIRTENESIKNAICYIGVTLE